MTDLKFVNLLEEIGQHISDSLHGNEPENAFMYAEAGDMWVEISVFKDRGNSVLYRSPTPGLVAAILELWEIAEPGKKWGGLSYKIENGRFDAVFLYPDDMDLDLSSFERGERVINEQFGDKPVDYSDPE